MAFEVNTGSTTIEFGRTLRIGYRTYGSAGSFSYLSYFPSYNELPYTFNLPSAGAWEIEYTQACTTCSGALYSDPATTVVTVTS